MKFLELKDISERYIELINPSSPEKIITIGKYAGLKPGKRVIDFGCGFGEPLVLWAQNFGISGIGIDIREYACLRAREKIAARSLSDQIEIVCGSGAEYRFKPGTFDVATCIGASFIWGGYQEAIQAMREAILPDGRLVIGEPYWRKAAVPPEFVQDQSNIHTEYQILQITRQEGFDIEYLVRANTEDWDRYEAGNWYGLQRWIEENPDHAERQEVINHLHESQEEYFRYGREYMGWALYLLNPVNYA